MLNRIIFIDSHIENYQSLIAQLPEDTKAVLLDAQRDGIEQILAAVQDQTSLSAIDIISHGSPGTIMLGANMLNNSNLNDYADQLAKLGKHLTDGGDILLYGCEVAQGETGQSFIEQLSQLTGADVAASINLTGAVNLGGDWLLEAHTGAINTTEFHSQAYDKTLATGMLIAGDESGNGGFGGSAGSGGTANNDGRGGAGMKCLVDAFPLPAPASV